MADTTRYHSLDFWRGVACLLVLAYHSNVYLAASCSVPFPWNIATAVFDRLWIGVPLFFVISGYCISATADKERRRKAGMRHYFKRRFRRIFPPYWAALALTLVTFMVFPALLSDAKPGIPGFLPIATLSLRDWIGNLTLTQTWLATISRSVHSLWDTRVYLGTAWTLCYEEQFYAITGFLLLVPRWFFVGAAGVTTVTLFSVYAHFQPIGLFLDGKWLEFGSGMAVYYALNHGSRRSRAGVGVMLAAGVLWWSRNPRALLNPDPHSYRQSLVVACTFAGVLLLAKKWDVPLSRSALTVPITSCGTRCYSIYLIHWPIVKLLTAAAAAAGLTGPLVTFFGVIPSCFIVVLACAWVFHSFIEQRFLNPPQKGLQVPRPA